MVMNSTRKSCFEEGEDTLEVGISGNIMNSNHYSPSMMSRSCSGYCQRRRTSIRDLMLSSSPISYFDARLVEDHEPHFLDSCFLCKKRLGDNRDIFMYRGDTPFCSEDCRQEQIYADESKEKKWNLSASMKALRNKDQNRSSSSPPKAQNYPFRSGTVVAG